MNKPLHESLTDRLRGMIFGGTYEKGDRLPTEPKLAKELGVSRATLREALKQLESEGAINRVHGLGTFVATTEPSITLDISVPRSVSRLIKSLGLMSGTSSFSVHREKVFPDDVERLTLTPHAEVMRIERIRTANGQPVAYTIDTVAAWVMKQYPERDDRGDFSLIEHLTYKCGIELDSTRSSLMPIHSVTSVAEKLEIDATSQIFLFEGIDRTTKHVPVVYSREYFAPWIFHLSVERIP